MVNLSFSTLPCEDWSPQRLIDYCQEHLIQGIELRETKGTWASADWGHDELQRIARQFEREKIIVTNIGSSVCIKGTSDEETDKWILELQALTNMAARLNAKGIRVFLGNFARRYDLPKVAIDHTRIVDCLRRACQYAECYGVEIWVESHNEYATGSSLARLLQDVDRPNCKVIWDVLHPLEDGESVKDTLKWIGKYCAHVHMKDGTPFDDPMEHDWCYTRIGDGIVPLEDIVSGLIQSGYDGFYSLEWETKWRKELQVPGSEPEIVIAEYVRFMANLNDRVREKKDSLE